MKPLLVHNGRTLFRGAIDHAHQLWEVDRVVAVVAPCNAQPLTQIGGADAWVIQPTPNDVIDAIQRGLAAIDPVKHPWTVILCADNVFETGDEGAMLIVSRRHEQPLFGARTDLLLPEAERFTKYTHDEKKGARFYPKDWDGFDGVWIGPLSLPTLSLQRTIEHVPNVEMMVNAACSGSYLVPLPMRCSDLGIPEAL